MGILTEFGNFKNVLRLPVGNLCLPFFAAGMFFMQCNLPGVLCVSFVKSLAFFHFFVIIKNTATDDDKETNILQKAVAILYDIYYNNVT